MGEIWDKIKTAADALRDNPEDSSGCIDLGDCFASMVWRSTQVPGCRSCLFLHLSWCYSSWGVCVCVCVAVSVCVCVRMCMCASLNNV